MVPIDVLEIGDRIEIVNDLSFSYRINDKMRMYEGKVATVTGNWGDYVTIDLDGGSWCWYPEFISRRIVEAYNAPIDVEFTFKELFV